MPKSTVVTEHGKSAAQHPSALPMHRQKISSDQTPPLTDNRPSEPTESDASRLHAALDRAREQRKSNLSLLKIVLIATSPTLHKLPVYYRLSEMHDVKLHVLFCCRHEPGCVWNIPPLDFEHTFLSERIGTINGRPMCNSINVVSHLKRLAPDVVVSDGFHPTHLYAFAYAAMKGIAHVPLTDGTDYSESTPNRMQHALRRFIYAHSAAFVSAGAGGHRLYCSYGIDDVHRFTSSPCVDNSRFSPLQNVIGKGRDATPQKRFDFLFSGLLEQAKNPLFALHVAIDVAKRLNRKTSILFAGGGSMEEHVRWVAAQNADLIDAAFSGHAMQDQLPALFRSARILLFPARWDRWDIVINQACAAGLPVIASPHSGVVGDLVIHEENGFVHELEIDAWGQHATMLLSKPDLFERFAQRSRTLVAGFTFDKAADGLVAACRHAFTARARGKVRKDARSRPRVVIVERQLLHYRVAVYERLRALLDKEDVELQLLVGEGTPDEKKKKDEVALDWTIAIPTRYFWNNQICWQPFSSYARDADMVIVMHENKLIYNLWLISFGRPRRLAFWGHGRNMQSSNPNGWRERFKRWTLTKVDWWFAYTDSTATLVTSAGFPRARTSVVDNAVDTREMAQFCNAISTDDCRRLRAEMGLENGPIGLYVGSLYEDKRLQFLLDAAKRIRDKVPGFQLLVVGAGPDQALIEAAANEHEWIHYFGPLQGQEKANMLALADVMLNPGLVGLGILDSFVAGSPMFTTDCDLHSPEISYMVSGQNGVMTDNDMASYVVAVVDTLNNPAELERLKNGALATASRYTVENMANRICNGIMACIASV